MSAAASSLGSCVVNFRGARVSVPLGALSDARQSGVSASAPPLAAPAAEAEAEAPDAAAAEAEDLTGVHPWEACALVLRILARDATLTRLCAAGAVGAGAAAAGAAGAAAAPSPTTAAWSALSLLDLSAGAGVVGIAAAVAGAAHVTLTDLPVRARALSAAAAASAPAAVAAGSLRALPLCWGDAGDLAALSASRNGVAFHLCVVSDVLYVAQRSPLAEAALRATLCSLLRGPPATCARAVLFVYQERSAARETAFMLALARDDGLCVAREDEPPLREDEALAAAGGCQINGDARTDLWTPTLFWEAPPLRTFVLRAACEPSAANTACEVCGGGGGNGARCD